MSPNRSPERSRRRQNRSRRPPGDENGTEHQLGDLIFRKKAPRSRHSAFLAQKINLASVGTGSAFNARAASIASDAKHEERSKNDKRNESTGPRGAAKQAWREQREYADCKQSGSLYALARPLRGLRRAFGAGSVSRVCFRFLSGLSGPTCFEKLRKMAPKCSPGGSKIEPKLLPEASRRPPRELNRIW